MYRLKNERLNNKKLHVITNNKKYNHVCIANTCTQLKSNYIMSITIVSGLIV